ncbi:MAG: SDR family oxidoreductase [Bacteroidetes bacterium]|nr:SDR family oxidoreductase [Bacteroidota bacterium]MCW5894737.1 SDR family oxidoreductase [Bacteroidota bacterium]
MNLLIVGATGGTGRELVKQALAQGHKVTAFVRNPADLKITHNNLTIAEGDVLDYVSVEKAVRGNDAVLSALGHKRWFVRTTILSEGTKNIITAMEKHGVKRFVCETTLGIGDTRGKLGLYYTLFVIPVIVFFYFRDKETQERYIKESTLDWIIVRPGQLTNVKKLGKYRHGMNIGSWFRTVSISRADVADFMLKQVTDNTYLRKTPAVAN